MPGVGSNFNFWVVLRRESTSRNKGQIIIRVSAMVCLKACIKIKVFERDRFS